jgi:hypothetical protein
LAAVVTFYLFLFQAYLGWERIRQEKNGTFGQKNVVHHHTVIYSISTDIFNVPDTQCHDAAPAQGKEKNLQHFAVNSTPIFQ